MKSICPTCKGPLYLPDNTQSLQKWSVLCARCRAIYLAYPGTVVGAWLRYSYHHRVVYQAHIHLQTGSTKTVGLDKLLNIDEPIVLLAPFKGLGKLKSILVIETQTASPYFLIHPRQHLRKYQLCGAIWMAILIVWLGLSWQGPMGAIAVVAMISSLAIATAISRVNRGEENTPQIRDRLLLEQRLIKHSDVWGKRLDQLEKELSSLHRINRRLRPYDENQLFRIGSVSKDPRERRHFEDKHRILSDLVGCYLPAKDLIDTSIPIMQLTEEVPLDLKNKLLSFSQKIEHLEKQYQVND